MIPWTASITFLALVVYKTWASSTSNILGGRVKIGGVTALHEIPSVVPSPHRDGEHRVAVGSKRGSIYVLGVSKDGVISFMEELGGEDAFSENEQKQMLRYPIYSIAGEGTTLFCGSGDRFISVWKSLGMELSSAKQGNWILSQRLGPHTGWVKDVLYDESCLFSIGCNCIETWKQTNENEWTHRLKSGIASDPSEGNTLSSDLLCLCRISVDGKLASGGVDGRIHVWNTSTMGKPIFHQAAHDGRVTALAFDELSGLLWSVGNDGCLKGWLYSDESLKNCNSVQMGSGVRGTALSCWRDASKPHSLQIAVGTSNGEVFLFGLDMGDKNHFRLLLQDELERNPVVNSILPLCNRKTGDVSSILLAHSDGLGSINYAKKSKQ